MPNQQPLKIAVLVSGNGNNLQVLIDQMLADALPIKLAGVISNKADAYALERVRLTNAQHHTTIQTAIIDRDNNGKKYDRVGFEQRALAVLGEWQLDLVVLAGFMRILTPLFIDGVSQTLNAPMINLHPSLLPAYKGVNTHQRVLQTGERLHGCSVHMVTSELDAGRVIAQAVTAITPHENAEQLQQRVHGLEYQLLPLVVNLFARRLLVWQSGTLVNQSGLPMPLRLWLD